MPAAEGAVIGGVARFEINTGTTETPAWKKIKDEVKIEISRTNNVVPRLNKDTGDHESAVKVSMGTKITVTAQENALPGSGYIAFGDIWTMSEKTYRDAGKGEYAVRVIPTDSGLTSLTGTALILNPSQPYTVDEIVEYTFEVQFITKPTAAEIA